MNSLFQEALRVVRELDLPDPVRPHLVAILEAHRPGPLTFLYMAGRDARLPESEILVRATGIFFIFCAGQLADDLIDDECTYLDRPWKLGPCLQFILHHLAGACLARASISKEVMEEANLQLAIAAGAQPLEFFADRFDFDLFRRIGEGIAGREWVGYLTILWAGTHLASRAARVGAPLGAAAYVALDVQSDDARFTSMSSDDQRQAIAWALASVETLRAEGLSCLSLSLPAIEPFFRS